MFVLTRKSWERYEYNLTVILAVASSVEALREYAKNFGCYPEMWEGDDCITAEQLLDGEVYSQECYSIEPVKAV